MFQQEERTFLSMEDLVSSRIYYRRPDITPKIRLWLAISATYCNKYGKITELSRDYGISRQFIYDIKRHFKLYSSLIFEGGFGINDIKTKQAAVKCLNRHSNIKSILSLRLEGKCSLQSISTILTRYNQSGLFNTSLGYISDCLQGIGKQLENTLETGKEQTYAVFASDEVFSSGRPILITADAISSAILRIDLCKQRSKEAWEKHWQGLLAKGVVPIYLTNDEGKGMETAHQSILSNTPRQTDTYHAFAHRFGDICRILQNKAYQAIEAEYERERVMNNAKTEEHKSKKELLYIEAKSQSEQLIDLYEDYLFWYQIGVSQFQLFDYKTGELREQTQAMGNMAFALQEIESLNWQIPKVKALGAKIKKHIATVNNLNEELFYFLDYAKQVVAPFLEVAKTDTDKEIFYTLCKAFQQDKNYRKVKSPKAKKYYQDKEEELITTAQILFEQQSTKQQNVTCSEFIRYAKKVYEALDTIVQASSLVETINSIIRSYCNTTRNQITQPQLNLIMFYHNHRRYKQGKRKGFSPMELLTGEKQEKNWLDLLLDKVQLM